MLHLTKLFSDEVALDRAAGMSRRAALRTGMGVGAGLATVSGAGAVTIMNGVVVGKNGWLFLAFDDPRQASNARLGQVTKIINDAVGLIRARGIECAILTAPAKARVYPEFLPEDWTFSPEAAQRYGLAVEQLRAGGAVVPDLAQVFAAQRRSAPGEALYFRNDIHWTPAAAELAATELVAQLSQRLRLPPSRAPGTRLGERVQMPGTENDLLNLLPAPERSKYQVEPFLVRRPLAATGRDALVQDDAADVAVVGNSFAQPKYNLAPMISSLLNRPVSLSWENHLKGPYRVLLDYVRSAGFKRHRPKVIVWNIIEQDFGLLPSDGRAFPNNAIAADEFLSGIGQALA